MKNLTLKEYEQFSAYLDGQLSAAEIRKLEEQLKLNPEWRLALDELNATRALLRRAPKYRAPRNFTISPEVARQYARKSWLPTFISFRLSGAVAALSVIAVMLLQLLPGLRLGAQLSAAPAADTQRNATGLAMPTQEAMKAAEAPQLSAPSSESATGATQPPIILWGDSGGIITSSQGLGRGGGGGGDASGQAITGEGIVTYNQEKVGPPMGGGAPDTAISPAPNGGIVNYGGQPSPDQNPSANTYTPPYSLPPQSAGALPEQPAQSVAPSNSPALEGAGPILGVPSTQEAGKIIAEGPITPQSEPAPSLANSGRQVAEQPAASFWTTTRIAQAGLLGLALLAGVTAFLMRRRMP